MNKPIAPKKPRKHERLPSETERVTKYVIKNNKGEIKLLSEEECDKTDDDGYFLWQSDGFENYGESVFYSDLVKIKNLLPPEISDFGIQQMVNRDGYYESTIIDYTIKKDPNKFKMEQDKFNNRFLEYDMALAEYRVQLEIYEKWKREQKLKKLNEEIKRLS